MLTLFLIIQAFLLFPFIIYLYFHLTLKEAIFNFQSHNILHLQILGIFISFELTALLNLPILLHDSEFMKSLLSSLLLPGQILQS